MSNIADGFSETITDRETKAQATALSSSISVFAARNTLTAYAENWQSSNDRTNELIKWDALDGQLIILYLRK